MAHGPGATRPVLLLLVDTPDKDTVVS